MFNSFLLYFFLIVLIVYFSCFINSRIQSPYVNCVCLTPILEQTFQLCLCLPCSFFAHSVYTKIFTDISHFLYTCYMSRTHLILLYLIILMRSGEELNLWSSSLCNFPPFPLTSRFSYQHVVLRHLQSLFFLY